MLHFLLSYWPENVPQISNCTLQCSFSWVKEEKMVRVFVSGAYSIDLDT